MINLAVIEIKDIMKYLVRLTIVLTIVIGLTRYFSTFKTQMIHKTEDIKQVTFLSCLDMTIPSIKEFNHKDEKELEKNKKESPIKMALGVELGMAETLIKNEEKNKAQGKTENKDLQKENNINDAENTKVESEEKIEEAKTGLPTEVLENNVPEKFTNTYKTVKIRNETKIKLTEEMLKPNVNINMKNILIYHTHSSESYTKSEKYKYEASGNFRTLDKERSVIRVGTELEKYMKNYGYKVSHDTTLYDYPSYNASYDRSYNGVKKFLETNKGTDILFDIHRDAIRR